MSVNFDPADDFPTVIDGVETVYLHRAGAGGTTAVDGSLKRRQVVREFPHSGGGVSAAEARWHLPLSVLNDAPGIGDRIVDAESTVWIIVEVRYEGLGRWCCLARDLAMVSGLSEQIDIERAVWTKDASGAAVATWHPWLAGRPARIQPVEVRIANEEGRIHVAATHRVLLADPVSVDQDCRVVGPDARIYRIIAHYPPANLDALEVLDVLEET